MSRPIKNPCLRRLMRFFCFEGICRFRNVDGTCRFTGNCPAAELVKFMDANGYLVYDSWEEFEREVEDRVKIVFCYNFPVTSIDKEEAKKRQSKAKLLRNKLYGYHYSLKDPEYGVIKSFRPGLVLEDERLDQSTFAVSPMKAEKVERLLKSFKASYWKITAIKIEKGGK